MTKWFIGVYEGEIKLLYGSACRQEFLEACHNWEAGSYKRLAKIYIEVQGDYIMCTGMRVRSVTDSAFAIVDGMFTIKSLEFMEES